MMKWIYLYLMMTNLVLFSCQSKGSKQDSNRRAAYSPVPSTPIRPEPAPLPQVFKTACYKTTPAICAIEVEILKRTNAYRQENGKSALKLGEKMSFASREWSRMQGERNRIGHSGFSRDRLNTIRNEYGTDSGIAMTAENVAMTYVRSRDEQNLFAIADRVAKSFVDMWIDSRGHRRNILSSTEVIGIGVYQTSSGNYYATQIFGRESVDTTIAEDQIDRNHLVRNSQTEGIPQNSYSQFGLGLHRH